MSHVFISYVGENSTTVARLAAELGAAGVTVWLDRNDINPGQRWQDAISDAIRTGKYFLACFSKEYYARPQTYMNEELNTAIEQLRQMPNDRAWFIPVLLDENAVPRLRINGAEDLSALHHVSLAANWDDGVARILKVLKSDPHVIRPIGLESPKGSRLPTTKVLSRVRVGVVLLGTCLAIVTVAAGVFSAQNARASVQSHVTHAGEHRAFVLPDASIVTLVGNSVLWTNFPEHPRWVILDRGEALFSVKHDGKQPFRVFAGHGCILDLGTQFDVRSYSRGVQVTVMEGAVEVIPRATAGGEVATDHAVRVTGGQEITYSTDGQASTPRPSDAAQVLAWTQGVFRYQDAPLWEVIEDLQRYVARPSIAIDPSISNLRYSGTIKQELLDEWVRALPLAFPVEVTSPGPDFFLIRRRT